MLPGHRRRTRRTGKDRISGLPDELLHNILRRLHSAAAAARTSALFRRWRGLWTHLPDLVFGEDDLFLEDAGQDDLIRREGEASFVDNVDAALAAYTDDRAVHVNGLRITVPYRWSEDVPARRIAPWLRFASRRLAGAFYLSVSNRPQLNREDDKLELPPCEGATRMQLHLGSRFLLRPPPAGMFTALTDLVIHQTTMEGRELEALLSSQCPRRRNLTLAVTLVATSDVSVRSPSLRRLTFHVRNTHRLDLDTPTLEILDASYITDAHIAAPNLAEVVLNDISGQIVVTDAGRHLRLLDVTRCSGMGPLMRRFDSVDELRLHPPVVRLMDYPQPISCL